MSERNGSAASDLEERVAALEAENAALRREVEALKTESVHNQSEWITPGDPRGRVG